MRVTVGGEAGMGTLSRGRKWIGGGVVGGSTALEIGRRGLFPRRGVWHWWALSIHFRFLPLSRFTDIGTSIEIE